MRILVCVLCVGLFYLQTIAAIMAMIAKLNASQPWRAADTTCQYHDMQYGFSLNYDSSRAQCGPHYRVQIVKEQHVVVVQYGYPMAHRVCSAHSADSSKVCVFRHLCWLPGALCDR
jgi:hypothetical protein